MPDTPAETLTAAAKTLRKAATADYVQPGPWIVHQATGFLRVDDDRDTTCEAWTVKSGADLAEENRGTAEYIALMHPSVGLALADWLNQAARTHRAAETAARRVWREDGDDDNRAGFIADRTDQHALAVARLLLGEIG